MKITKTDWRELSLVGPHHEHRHIQRNDFVFELVEIIRFDKILSTEVLLLSFQNCERLSVKVFDQRCQTLSGTPD